MRKRKNLQKKNQVSTVDEQGQQFLYVQKLFHNIVTAEWCCTSLNHVRIVFYSIPKRGFTRNSQELCRPSSKSTVNDIQGVTDKKCD